MTTDCASAYPPALAAVLPAALRETGKAPRRRIERDHQHLKGRVRGMRGFKTMFGAGVFCRAHAFLRNVRSGYSELGRMLGASPQLTVPPTLSGWETLTADLLTW